MGAAQDAASGIVVLLSGGLDSATLLHYAASVLGRKPVRALTFNYGQRHVRELAFAQWQASAAGVLEHRVIDLAFLGDLLQAGSVLIAGGAPVPNLDEIAELERKQPPTYVPHRNIMLLSMAAAYAEAQGICDVYYGAQAQDEYGYWDCTPVFLERLNGTLALNRVRPVTVHAPFMTWKKADILRAGLDLGVDYAHTWTCYRGGERACGTCPSCMERLNAFRALGRRDPLNYQE